MSGQQKVLAFFEVFLLDVLRWSDGLLPSGKPPTPALPDKAAGTLEKIRSPTQRSAGRPQNHAAIGRGTFSSQVARKGDARAVRAPRERAHQTVPIGCGAELVNAQAANHSQCDPLFHAGVEPLRSLRNSGFNTAPLDRRKSSI